ncbi:MAG: hypothetical protein ABEL04_06890 [Salinibacter sp.]|uniref:hypothetical protein n=1 Tax=Salinibacter sp. TaxID=2065818 RepID=UPI0035D4659E
MSTHRFRPLLACLLGVILLPLTTLPASAQSAQSIAEKMKARYQEQLQNVDNYVVETNMHTSYHRKVMKDGAPALETEVKMKGQDQSSLFSAMGNAPTTTSSKPAYYEDLSENATYAGTETVNGVKCHVLKVKNPSKMNRDAQSMTYYVDAEKYVPTRLKMVQPPKKEGGKPTGVVVNFEDYRTTEGITLPWRTTMDMKMDMSKQQRRQMKKAMQQLEKLPKSQREMMKNQMPMSFERMKRIMSGEPMTIKVQDVRVNADIPKGMFN